jgi:hypothetical protein
LFLKTDGAGNLSFSSDLPTTSFTGATVETSIADSDLVLIYDDSATAVRKMTKANLVSGIGASAGQVIQVVSTTKTDTFSVSSTSFSDVTGLSVSITPSSASNKILVIVSIAINGRDGVVGAFAKLVRNSTDIFIGDSAGSRTRVSAFVAENATCLINCNLTHLDLPSTTSETTYKIQLAGNNANAVYINKADTDSDSSGIGRTASSITVMEIKG